jgi:hypothetical protein
MRTADQDAEVGESQAPLELHAQRDSRVTVLWNFINIQLGEMTLHNKPLPWVGSAGKQRGVRHDGNLATLHQEPNSPRDAPSGVAFDANLYHSLIRCPASA